MPHKPCLCSRNDQLAQHVSPPLGRTLVITYLLYVNHTTWFVKGGRTTGIVASRALDTFEGESSSLGRSLEPGRCGM